MYCRAGIYLKFFPMNSEEDRLVEYYLAELSVLFPGIQVEKTNCDYLITFFSLQDAKVAERWLDTNS